MRPIYTPTSIPQYEVTNPLDNGIITMLHIIFFAGIGALVYISPHIKNKKVIKICILIGGLTYPLYLMHQTIGNTFIRYFMNRYGFPGAPLAYIFEVLVIIVAYSIYLQDKKMREWLGNKFLTKNTNASTVR